jgi:hypothetical protein
MAPMRRCAHAAASRLTGLALLVALATGCVTVREGSRGLFTLGDDTRVVATWESPAAPLYAHLIEATRVTFPEATIRGVANPHGVRFWLGGVIQQPAQTGFQLEERQAPDGKTVTDLVALPLRTSASNADLPLQYPPYRQLVAEMEQRSGLRPTQPASANHR